MKVSLESQSKTQMLTFVNAELKWLITSSLVLSVKNANLNTKITTNNTFSDRMIESAQTDKLGNAGRESCSLTTLGAVVGLARPTM